jgi:hypothetical protein
MYWLGLSAVAMAKSISRIASTGQNNAQHISDALGADKFDGLASLSVSRGVSETQIKEQWTSIDDQEKSKRLEALQKVFFAQLENCRAVISYYSSVYQRRMYRYNFLRIAIVVLMIGGLITQLLYNGMEHSFGLDKLVTVFAPVLIGGAIIFYVTQAFLKDYEVAIEAGRISETMVRFVGRQEARWATEVTLFGNSVEAAISANEVVTDVSRCQIDLDPLLAAERAATLSDLKSISYG